MLRVLSGIMEMNFAKLSEYDLIDLCYENKRFPAVVVSIDYIGRAFEVVPLSKTMLIMCLSGSVSAQEPKTIKLTDSPSNICPSWNLIGK